MKPNVFDFATFAAFFRAYLDWAKDASGGKLSLRWFAKRLGLKSHAFLVQVANGNKLPTAPKLERLGALFELSVEQALYAGLLAELGRAKAPEERGRIGQALSELRGQREAATLATAHFAGDSFHLAATLFEMSKLPGFAWDAAWIAPRLRQPADAAQIAAAIAGLAAAGLIVGDAAGYRRAHETFSTSHNVSSAAIRDFHRQMLRRAEETLEAVPVPERLFFGHSLPVAARQLADAARLILEFRMRFEALLAAGDPAEWDAVYHLGVQFVPLTRRAEA